MKIVADRVHPDEACHGLVEVDRMTALADGSRQLRRVQEVYVVRGDSIASFAVDMGPADEFVNAAPIAIFSMGDDTVGQLRDMAEKDRMDDTFKKLRDEVRESSTLIPDFLREKEENWERINNRSVFGPGITKQRNGYSKKAAWEN